MTHLEEESGGVVSVRRLDKNSPQFLRCRRATVENARKDYFTVSCCSAVYAAAAARLTFAFTCIRAQSAVPGGGRYKGMVVTNVFRVEHKAVMPCYSRFGRM